MMLESGKMRWTKHVERKGKSNHVEFSEKAKKKETTEKT
jgi:hypothetical protein